MTLLVAAALTFFLMRRLISGGPLRPLLVRWLGTRLFLGLYSLATLAALAGMVVGYRQAHLAGEGATAWSVEPWAAPLMAAVQLLAVIFIVAGVATPNPASAGQAKRLGDLHAAHGILRITRHPFLWGVVLFSAGHLALRVDPASLVFFGTLLVVAMLGTFSIDAKLKQRHGAAWNRFAANTSNLPFAAIAAGRQRLAAGEIGWVRMGASLAVWALLVWRHADLSDGAALFGLG